MSSHARLAGFSMPAEWARHERTWMEFPPANTTFGDDPEGDLGHYRRVWTDVTNAIARFEPVSLICDVATRGCCSEPRRPVGDHPRDAHRRQLVPRQWPDVRHSSRRPARRSALDVQRLGPTGVLRVGRRAARRRVRSRTQRCRGVRVVDGQRGWRHPRRRREAPCWSPAPCSSIPIATPDWTRSRSRSSSRRASASTR